MPRKHRARRKDDEPSDLSQLLVGWRRTETKRGRTWIVQPIGAGRSEKAYVCPGCSRPVVAGAAHIVCWPADSVLGDESALADRRHWHTGCWNRA